MSFRPGKACFVASVAAALTPFVMLIVSMALDAPLPDAGPVAVNALGWLVLVTPLALAHALVLGLPAYLLLSCHWRLTWWRGVLGGFLVGVTPIGIFAAWDVVARGPGHEPTAALIAILLLFGLSGAVGGLVFWLLMRRPGDGIPA